MSKMINIMSIASYYIINNHINTLETKNSIHDSAGAPTTVWLVGRFQMLTTRLLTGFLTVEPGA
jgi:hypothetical protein